MPKTILSATATLCNEKVRFCGITEEKTALYFDYYPPIGDGDGYTPLELLLLSLSACSGTSIIALLRKTQKRIDSFQVNAMGIRRDTHPTIFETIRLQYLLISNEVTEDEFTHAINLTENSLCPVWAMLRDSVHLSSTHVLKQAE